MMAAVKKVYCITKLTKWFITHYNAVGYKYMDILSVY